MAYAYRLGVKIFLREFEDRRPGTGHEIVRGFDGMVGALGGAYPQASLAPHRLTSLTFKR